MKREDITKNDIVNFYDYETKSLEAEDKFYVSVEKIKAKYDEAKLNYIESILYDQNYPLVNTLMAVVLLAVIAVCMGVGGINIVNVVIAVSALGFVSHAVIKSWKDYLLKKRILEVGRTEKR